MRGYVRYVWNFKEVSESLITSHAVFAALQKTHLTNGFEPLLTEHIAEH